MPGGVARASLGMVQEHYEHQSSGPLAAWVSRAVGYRHDGLTPGVHIGMPSGRLTLVVSLDEPLVLSQPAGGEHAAYGGIVAGLHTGPAHIHHGQRQQGVQLALTPVGARALFGMPAGELAQRSVDLQDVVGEAGRQLRDELHELGSWSARFAAVERLLIGCAARTERRRGTLQPRAEVAEAWRVVERSGGRVPVRTVAEHVGWSVRQLELRFTGEFGLGPKAAARVARFERSVPWVRDTRRPLAEIAADCGYTDQPHLTGEWKALAGMPPSRWRSVDQFAFVQDDDAPTG